MNNDQFQKCLEESFQHSKEVLNIKEKEYSIGLDRLDQFKRTAVLNDESATRSLWGMAVKHVTSIATMVKDPTMYNLETWREKVTDLRNYTFLLGALLEDLKIESTNSEVDDGRLGAKYD